jgi:hypothetical protein
MANNDAERLQLEQAAEEAGKAVSLPSITDCVPAAVGTIGNKPAAHICAAVLRIAETVRMAVERRDGIMEEQDAGYLIVYLRLRGADRFSQMALWQASRKPLELYYEFVQWMFATSVGDFLQAAKDSSEALNELNRVGKIISGDDGETGIPTTAGVTGSP